MVTENYLIQWTSSRPPIWMKIVSKSPLSSGLMYGELIASITATFLTMHRSQAGFNPPIQSATQVLKLSRRFTSKPPQLDQSGPFIQMKICIFDKKKNRKLANIRPSLNFYGIIILVKKAKCIGMAWLGFQKSYKLIGSKVNIQTVRIKILSRNF